jgi:hypothetical protein
MSSNQPLTVLLPPGRIVSGNLYEGDATDFDGNPAFFPQGHPKAGQAKISYYFAVAIPKVAGHTHWGFTDWGAQILAFGRAAWPSGQADAPTFAWKIGDGDSTVPNKKGKKNCDREGNPGHWIVGLSSSYAPRIYTRDAGGRAAEWLVKDAIKPGDFAQVQITVASNERNSNPGVYLNHSMVMFLGYGERIRMGADPNSVQWAAPPAGASAIPTGGAMPSNTPPPAPGAAPPPPGTAAAPPPPAAAAAPPPAVAVAPSPGFTAPPPPPAAAPAPTGPVMTAKAGSYTYAQMIAAGWTDATLKANGYLV